MSTLMQDYSSFQTGVASLQNDYFLPNGHPFDSCIPQGEASKYSQW